MNDQPPSTPIPLTLLTGFLGAGKTTVLNRILAGDHGLRIAVMVNDFGNLDIADELIAGKSEGVLKLTNGCICCSLKEDLVGSVLAVVHREPAPQHIVLEASGVADPTGIATTLLAPVLRSAIRLDGVVCVVDAQQFDVNHPERDLILRQLMVSDLILLNKIDLVPEEIRERMDRQIRTWLSAARILHTVQGNAPLPVLLSSLHEKHPSRHPLRAHTGSEQQCLGEACNDPAHDHPPQFDVWYFRTPHALSAPALREVAQQLPSGIYRIKGIARLTERASTTGSSFAMVQGVGRRLQLVPISAPGTEETRLVVIGAVGTLDSDALQRAFGQTIRPGGTPA
jgi:G3E family GTPase